MPDNSVLPDFSTVEVNKVALAILQEAAITEASIVVQISLASLLFGILTILDITSIYFFISRGSLAQPNGRILLLSILFLYMFTATYMAGLIWAWSDRTRLITTAVQGSSSASYDGLGAITASERATHLQSLMITLVLGGNIVIGDAIVWWRACVIWRHRVVNYIGVLLLTLTMIFGIIGVATSQSPATPSPVFLYDGIFGQLSALLSLCSNILATALIAYKAWKHKQLMRRHFVAGGTTSLVLKALALLVESGCIYIVVLVFAIIYGDRPAAPLPGAELALKTVAIDFAYGCFVPLIALYPTIIIVLVAFRRSPIDSAGLSQARQAHGGSGSMVVEGVTTSTIVFHHSTFRSAASVGTESAAEEIPGPAGEPARSRFQWARSLGRSASNRETKVVGTFAQGIGELAC